jgi:cytochrome c-type biogenesis protein CcmF
MTVGDHVELAGYRFTLMGLAETSGPNYAALRAAVRVQPLAAGAEAGTTRAAYTLHPEKRLYKVQQMPMTEAAIDSGLTRDLYVSLGEALDEKTWTMRIHHKPFVAWIWGGAVLMALGGALAAADRRYRLGRAAAAEPAALATGPAPGSAAGSVPAAASSAA